MPMWRCPHCGTPQAETARCWVCHRSSTACATCQHFRRSVAAQLGYCGLDRERRPLRGDEIRGCWEASATPPDVAASVPVAPTRAFVDADGYRTPVRTLEFVEVETRPLKVRSPAARTSRRTRTPVEAEPVGATGPTPSEDGLAAEAPLPIGQPEPGWSLWSDLES